MTLSAIVSLCLVLGAWGPKLLWELWVLWKRRKDARHWPTISMAMRDARFKISSYAYIVPGMLTHWLVPWREATAVGGVTFWVIGLALLVQDVKLARTDVATWPAWLKWQRTAGLWLIAGALGGLLLFPQAP